MKHEPVQILHSPPTDNTHTRAHSINYCSLMLTLFGATVVIWVVLWVLITHQFLLGHSGQTQHIYLQNKNTNTNTGGYQQWFNFLSHSHSPQTPCQQNSTQPSDLTILH